MLRYEPDTGKLFWKERDFAPSASEMRRWNTRYANTEAFTSLTGGGYTNGHILGRWFRGHRVVWAIFYGEWPGGVIDHIDGNCRNNRIENLREVSRTVNSQNCARAKNNSSGVTGVKWRKNRSRWEAEIKVAGRAVYLGNFRDLPDAVAARKAAESRYGFHPNHDRERFSNG